MNFSKQRLSIEEARQTDMVDYLSRLGYQPAKVRGIDYWYLSPLREERTPSFKINRKLNRWYDHGLGKGGNIIDFGILFNGCTIGEFLHQLSGNLSFQEPQVKHPGEQAESNTESKIKIISEKPISSFALLRYLHQRRLPIDLVEGCCKEITYELNSKEYFAIGFKNNAGGYELRNPYFKASSAPKDITTFNNGASEASVFEGFTDFLSFMTIHKDQPQIPTDFVILNSVSLFEKARPFMEKHESIRLYLDRDTTGQNYSRYALSLSLKYKDESGLYRNHKDLNDWLVNFGKAQKKSLGFNL
ncbi:MAG: toprim domain-containing protein [Ginsengibacter sp.]